MSLRIGFPLILSALLASCGGGGAGTPAPVTPPAPPVQSLSLNGDTGKLVQGGGGVTLSATAAVAAAVSWTLEQGPGALSASSGASVTYTPPACCLSGGNNAYVVVTAKAGEASKSLGFWVYPAPAAPGLSLVTGTIGSAGNLDGKGDAARFTAIESLTADTGGNLLLLDALAPTRLRRVSSAGVVSTLPALPDDRGAPLSISATADATVLLTRRSDGLAVYNVLADGSTSLLLAPARTDQTAQRVVAGLGGTLYLLGTRQVTLVRADGSSSVAGNDSDTSGVCRDGSGADARLLAIQDGVADASGNLLVADCYSVRKISAAGVVTTVAGDLADSGPGHDGSGAGAHFGGWLSSLAVAPDGALLSLSYDHPRFSSDGSDSLTYRLSRVSSSGSVTTVSTGSVANRAALPAEFGPQRTPGAAGPYRYVRYLADGSAVLATPARLYRLDGASASPLAGNEGDIVAAVEGPVAGARLVNPQWLSANPDGTLYALDGQGNVYQLTRAGMVSKLFQDAAVPEARPAQIAYKTEGLVLSHVRAPNPGDKHQYGGAVIYIRRLMDFYQTRAVLAGASLAVKPGDARVDGPGNVATFYKADLLGFDADGNLYVEDARDNQPLYRKVTPAGEVSTIAALPAGLGAGQDGYRYRYAPDSGLVYRLTAAGGRTPVAGTAGLDGIQLGALPGSLSHVQYGQPAGRLVPLTLTGLNTYAFISGAAILQLVVPPVGGN